MTGFREQPMRVQSMAQAGLRIAGLALCAAAPAPAYAPPVPLRNAAPAYPAALQALSAEGSVEVACSITATGSPRDCAITGSTDHRFDAAALSYGRASLYRPATSNGIPVTAAHHTLMVNFRLTQHAEIACDYAIDHTGRVGRCTVTSGGATSMLPLVGHILAPMHVMPTLRDGQPVDDPHRQVRVVLEQSSYPSRSPLAPLPPSEATGTLYAACRTALPAAPGMAAHRACTVVDEPALQALIARRAQTAQPAPLTQIRFGITGLQLDRLPAEFAGPD